MSFRRRFLGLTFILIAHPSVSEAHSFATPYVPPLPLWMYIFACAATLIVTFASLSWLVTQRNSGVLMNVAGQGMRRTSIAISASYLVVARGCALVLFTLTIFAGLVGEQDPERNIAMIMFWVIFLLLFAYATAITGNIFPLINPWVTIVAGLERLGIDLSRSRIRYPDWLAYWPALIFYMVLIWIELFAPAAPRIVSIILLGYTAVTLAGVALFGKSTWFSQADFFGVYFLLIGKLAPIEHEHRDSHTWKLHLRHPLTGGGGRVRASARLQSRAIRALHALLDDVRRHS